MSGSFSFSLPKNTDPGPRSERDSQHIRRRRNRHGRGPRGPLFLPHIPAWRTRKQRFDQLAIETIRKHALRWPAVHEIEFAVEEVPPSDPAPWERKAVVLGRSFAADRVGGLAHRIVIYRRPIEHRCEDNEELKRLLNAVIVENVASALALEPEEIDPQWEL